MAIPTVTREYMPGSCLTLRKPRRLLPRREMKPDSLELGAESLGAPNQTRRNLNLLDGTLESTPEHPHMSRRTLMSPQECEITWCSPNQLKIMPDSPALAPVQFPVPHHTRQWLDFL